MPVLWGVSPVLRHSPCRDHAQTTHSSERTGQKQTCAQPGPDQTDQPHQHTGTNENKHEWLEAMEFGKAYSQH